jgi:hypothetical protein
MGRVNVTSQIALVGSASTRLMSPDTSNKDMVNAQHDCACDIHSQFPSAICVFVVVERDREYAIPWRSATNVVHLKQSF